MEFYQDMENFQVMEMILDMEMILGMKAKHHTLYHVSFDALTAPT